MCLLQKECELEETQDCRTLLMECTSIALGDQHDVMFMLCSESRSIYQNSVLVHLNIFNIIGNNMLNVECVAFLRFVLCSLVTKCVDLVPNRLTSFKITAISFQRSITCVTKYYTWYCKPGTVNQVKLSLQKDLRKILHHFLSVCSSFFQLPEVLLSSAQNTETTHPTAVFFIPSFEYRHHTTSIRLHLLH